MLWEQNRILIPYALQYMLYFKSLIKSVLFAHFLVTVLNPILNFFTMELWQGIWAIFVVLTCANLDLTIALLHKIKPKPP